MKHRLLNRQEQERLLNEKWEAIGQMSDEDSHRQDAVDEALQTQKNIYKQLDDQDKALPILWELANTINPENPLGTSLLMLANADRLKTILKSYQTVSA